MEPVVIDFTQVDIHEVLQHCKGALGSRPSLSRISNYLWTAWTDGTVVSVNSAEHTVLINYEANSLEFWVGERTDNIKHWNRSLINHRMASKLRNATEEMGRLTLVRFAGGVYLV